MPILSVNNLGKAYKQYFTRWSRLAEWCLPLSKPRYQLHWALQSVSFQVHPGEALGIAGMNGAGKSTLLKIIAGTTQPTTGSLETNGRIAALLELGMGFHPDFTGRQNVVMAGQLFGFLVDEIQSLMPEIETFAEIGEYIDQPVRTYSSGMLMRLAFAVATAKRPDVLIVDEALSVGDSYFQHKSFSRIRKFREEGTTLLLVSHDRMAIQSICDRVVLLHEGKVVKEGLPEETMDFYHALLAARDLALVRQERQDHGNVQTISGGGEVSISEIRLLNKEGKPVEAVETGTLVTLEIKTNVNRPVPESVIGFLIKDRFGQNMYGINSYRLGQTIESLTIGDQLVCCFQFEMNLGKGNYSIAAAISREESHLAELYEWRDGSFVFSVLNTKKPDFVGCAFLNVGLSTRYIPQRRPDWSGKTLRMAFMEPDECSEYLDGFYQPETWGAWSRIEEPMVLLPCKLSGVVRLQITACGYANNVNRNIFVSLGAEKKQMLLGGDLTQSDIIFSLNDPAYILTFSGLDLSPVPNATDPRSLGIGLQSLEISLKVFQ